MTDRRRTNSGRRRPGTETGTDKDPDQHLATIGGRDARVHGSVVAPGGTDARGAGRGRGLDTTNNRTTEHRTTIRGLNKNGGQVQRSQAMTLPPRSTNNRIAEHRTMTRGPNKNGGLVPGSQAMTLLPRSPGPWINLPKRRRPRQRTLAPRVMMARTAILAAVRRNSASQRLRTTTQTSTPQQGTL